MTVTPELTYEAHRAAMSNTDDADTRTVLLAILSCAQAWEGSVRILGNVRASDAVRALSAALSVPAEAVVGEPVAYASSKEWRKNHLMSAAQYKSALSKNVVDFDIPLYAHPPVAQSKESVR